MLVHLRRVLPFWLGPVCCCSYWVSEQALCQMQNPNRWLNKVNCVVWIQCDADPPGAEQLEVLCAPICWGQSIWPGFQSHQCVFVCSLGVFLAAQQACTQGKVICAGDSDQITSSASSLILPSKQVGALCRAARDGQQAVLFKSRPESIGKEVLCNEKYEVFCNIQQYDDDDYYGLCIRPMWNEVVDVKHKNIWDNITSIWNKKWGGEQNQGKSKGSMFV